MMGVNAGRVFTGWGADVRRGGRALGGSVALLAAISACAGEAPVPTELAPLDPVNRASLPGPAGGVEHPEALVVDAAEGPEYDSVHARGYVRAPIAKVWAALQEIDALVDRRRVDEWSVERDVLPDAAVSFLVHNVVNDVVTVEFDTTWRAGVVDGDAGAPLVVAARGSKTAGSSFIEVLEDSILAREVEEDVTELQLIRRIRSVSADADDAALYLEDLHASIAARAKGAALPAWQ